MGVGGVGANLSLNLNILSNGKQLPLILNVSLLWLHVHDIWDSLHLQHILLSTCRSLNCSRKAALIKKRKWNCLQLLKFSGNDESVLHLYLLFYDILKWISMDELFNISKRNTINLFWNNWKWIICVTYLVMEPSLWDLLQWILLFLGLYDMVCTVDYVALTYLKFV